MAATRPARLEAGRRNFLRVVVGIDGSQQALEAARQAALLQEVDGRLTLVAAWTGDRAPCDAALAAAREYVAPYTDAACVSVRDDPAVALLAEIERDRGTLVAVGSSGTGHLGGPVDGSVGTTMLARAPCSVLVARPAGDRFPTRVAVGADGSAGDTASYLAERFGAALRTVAPELLLEASERADLVVGNVQAVTRGSSCSALLVRDPPVRRLLVVLADASDPPALVPEVRARSADVLVLVPALGPDTQWYVDADARRADATQRLRTVVSTLAAAGVATTGRLGAPDPVEAIADALGAFAADAILLVTAPGRPAGWLPGSAVERARATFRLPVEHLVLPAGPC